ncbi:hypothetical protein Ancab_015658 [Ancistrocladus abbreviatus]
MAVGFKLSKPPTPLSSLSLQKFLKSQKNLSKSPPKLWTDLQFRSQDDDFNDNGMPTLNLNHPILRTLDSCTTLAQFNQVHTQLIVFGLFQHPLAASRVIKKLCSLPCRLDLAVSLFEKLEEPDAFMCNTIVRSFVNLGDPKRALLFYYQFMIGRCIKPNHYTFPLLVKVCGDIASVSEGAKTHSRAVKSGFEFDLFVRNSLIHMYAVCGRVEDARKVFDGDSVSDLVTWNTMIDGYGKNGQVTLARHLFDEMYDRDLFTWNSMIAGHAGIGEMEAAWDLFETMPRRDVVSWNCMIDGYARMGDVEVASAFFESMPAQNVVSWNTILALFVRCKKYTECLELFDQLIQGGEATPDEATLVSVLTACAYLGRLDKGKWVHSYMKTNRRIEPDVLLLTALLTMYVKCGDMDMAKDVFDNMPEKSVVSWNSMIMGYGTHGLGGKALEMFLDMEKSGQLPNDATFTCVLAACAHAGMVLEGWWYFDVMLRVYKVEPKVEHYGCMVDLLSRAGFMKDSEELIQQMPMEAGSALWGALLSACRTHSNSQLGEIVGKRLIEQEPEDIGPYVLLSNIYATEGRWDDVENVRRLMKDRGLQKLAGSSLTHFGEIASKTSLEVGMVHRKTMIYSMLREMGAHIKLSW